MEATGAFLQEQAAVWAPLLSSVAAALPGVALTVSFLGGLGGLASVLITERAKANHLRDLEGVKVNYQKDVEAAKADLQGQIERLKADLSKDTESFRAQLNTAAFERQTTFAQIHEKTILVTGELYKQLVVAHRAVGQMVKMYREGLETTDEAKQRDGENAASAMNDFNNYFNENRIWVDEALVSDVERFIGALRGAFYMWVDPDEETGVASQRGKAWRTVTQDATKIRQEIEARMRLLLAVTSVPGSVPPAERPGQEARKGTE